MIRKRERPAAERRLAKPWAPAHWLTIAEDGDQQIKPEHMRAFLARMEQRRADMAIVYDVPWAEIARIMDISK